MEVILLVAVAVASALMTILIFKEDRRMMWSIRPPAQSKREMLREAIQRDRVAWPQRFGGSVQTDCPHCGKPLR